MIMVRHANSTPRPATAWRVRQIVGAVAYVSGISSARIMSRRKVHLCVDARFIVVRIARNAGRSWHEIGRVLGQDHSTAISAYRRFESFTMLGGVRGKRLAEWHGKALERLAEAPAWSAPEPVVVEPPPAEPPPPAPPPQPPLPAAPRPRHGFVNRHGEIIVGPALNEVIEDRWHRDGGWKRP